MKLVKGGDFKLTISKNRFADFTRNCRFRFVLEVQEILGSVVKYVRERRAIKTEERS